MIISSFNREYCQLCGVDFSNRSYSDKIHHSNHCDDFNANAGVYGFKEAKTEKEKLEWLFEAVGIDCNVDRTTYEATMEIFECLIKMYRRGVFDNDVKLCKHTEIANYMESKRGEIKKQFNKLIQKKISEIENENKIEIKYLKERMVK